MAILFSRLYYLNNVAFYYVIASAKTERQQLRNVQGRENFPLRDRCRRIGTAGGYIRR